MILHRFTQSDDLPNATAAFVDEQTWVNPVAPYVAPTVMLDPWLADEQVPALTAAYLDEQTWMDPVQHVLSFPVPQLISDDQVIVPQPPQGIGDDNEIWLNPVLPYVAPYLVPSPAVDEQTPALVGRMDEDFWINGVAPVGAYPVPALITDDGNFARPVIASQILWLN